MSGREVVLFLQFLTLVGSALTAVKLYRSGLYKSYPVFFCYFLFSIPDSIWSLCLPAHSNAYFYCWVFTEPLFWVFHVLVVRELFGLVLKRHKGLYTVGRWAMYFGVAISVTLSLFTMLVKFHAGAAQRSGITAYYYGTDRGVNLCLALFLILMVVLISRYPVRLERNIILHTVLFTVFFLGNSLTSLLRSVLGILLFTSIDTGLMALAAACTFGWFFLLVPKGEEVQVPRQYVPEDREERLLYHLDSLNAALLKVARK